MKPEDVIEASDYLFRKPDDGEHAILHISRSLVSSRRYRYNEKGKYIGFEDSAP